MSLSKTSLINFCRLFPMEECRLFPSQAEIHAVCDLPRSLAQSLYDNPMARNSTRLFSSVVDQYTGAGPLGATLRFSILPLPKLNEILGVNTMLIVCYPFS
jgi:hypothetical protein